MNGRTNSPGGAIGSDLQIPLDPPSEFTPVSGNNQVLISWVDPNDKYATPEGEVAQDPHQLISVWEKTVIVRKVGSAPTSINDGTVILSSTIRNQYQSTEYTDNTVTNNTEYYYAAYAVNEDNIESEAAISNVTPKGYEPTLENNTWTQINDAASKGLAQSMWEIGDTKSIVANGRSLSVAILDFNHDFLTDGSGKAKITFGTMDRVIDDVYANDWDWDDEHDTGGPSYALRYSKSQIRDRLINTVYPSLEAELKSCIKSVTKYNYYCTNNSTALSTESTNDPVFAFDPREIDFTGQWNPNLTTGSNRIYPYFSTPAVTLRSYPIWLRPCFYSGSTFQYATVSLGSYDSIFNNNPFDHINNGPGGNIASISFGFCI